MAKEKKPSQGLIYKNIVNAMNKQPCNYMASEYFEWKHNLVLVKERTAAAYTILLVDKDNVCTPVNTDWVAHEILKALAPYQHLGSEFALDLNQCKNAAHAWVAYNSDNALSSHPRPVAFINEADYLCYRRLPFVKEKYQDAAFPVWSEILSRMTNSKAFCIFVYSLFERSADISQYLYIYGEGGSGKSTIGAWLQRLMGSAFTTAASSQMFGEHWSEAIVGKRLCYVKEANSAFPGSDKMKGLTGDRQILINPKGKPAYMTEHQCKFVFVSNYRLELDSKSENQRRAIYCELPKFEGKAIDESAYQEMLWNETQDFLMYCMSIYNEHCYGGKIIPVDNKQYDELIGETELEINTFIENWFERDDNSQILSPQFQQICAAVGMNKQKKREVMEHLRRTWKIRTSSARDENNKVQTSFKGMRLTEYGTKQVGLMGNVYHLDRVGK